MATNYDINYNDEQLKAVESAQSAALNEIDKTYGGMISDSEAKYDKLIQESEAWKDEQTRLQQEQTDFAIERIEQQKEQAEKDYTKEQSGAYVDWQKQSNQYGANAEAMAAQGLAGTGFSESSQVSMYNAYQNRVATAREAYSRAVLNYDNSIKEAMLQNSSILAEIAHQAFVEQTQLALESLQYKNQLLDTMFSKQMDTKKFYASEYQTVLDQLENEQDNPVIDPNKTNPVAKPVVPTQAVNKDAAYDDMITSPYYKGKVNSDCAKFGTMYGGYQPKGITGHGILTPTTRTVSVELTTLDGKKTNDVQTIWKAADNTYWYWNEKENKYIEATWYKADPHGYNTGGNGGIGIAGKFTQDKMD